MWDKGEEVIRGGPWMLSGEMLRLNISTIGWGVYHLGFGDYAIFILLEEWKKSGQKLNRRQTQ